MNCRRFMTGILFRREDVIIDIIIISLLGSSSLVALLERERCLLEFCLISLVQFSIIIMEVTGINSMHSLLISLVLSRPPGNVHGWMLWLPSGCPI